MGGWCFGVIEFEVVVVVVMFCVDLFMLVYLEEFKVEFWKFLGENKVLGVEVLFIVDGKKLEGRKSGLLIFDEFILFGVMFWEFVLWIFVFIFGNEFCLGIGIFGGGWFDVICWKGWCWFLGFVELFLNFIDLLFWFWEFVFEGCDGFFWDWFFLLLIFSNVFLIDEVELFIVD